MTAVIYARYSSDNQREESIEGQIRECTAYAEKNGITVVKHYIDRALSAKTDNRPDFQQMIKDSEKRLFDIVLVWKLDRFARNRYDSAHYEYQLERNHVKLVSATEPISDSPAGIMVKSMLTGMAEYYSAELSEKVVRGMTENVLKGKYNGGTIPIGFKVDEEKFFQVDPLKAPFVVEAFQRYNEGATMKELMNWLNDSGVTTNRNQKFTYNSVQKLLTNKRYIGENHFKDIVMPDSIPAIVDKDLFEEVQLKIKKNSRAPARHKAEDDYLLTTKLFCGMCGAMMFGECGTGRNKVVHHYYKCATAKRFKTCKKKTVRKEWLEDLVIAETMKLIQDDAVIDAIVAEVMELQDQENTTLPLLEKQMREVENGIENMMNAIQAGVLTNSTKLRLEKLEAQQKELEVRIAEEKIARPRLSENQVRFWLTRFRKLDPNVKSHRETLINTFVNAVYLYDEKVGGYRLNTDFGEVKTDLGRMFGFSYGDKENGAVFSHMAVMYANALYKRGFAKEGCKSLHALYRQSANFEVSHIYPGIPEYFNGRGRGMYHYLTGAASWYMLTVITEMFGVRGQIGDMILDPKLLKEQFDEEKKASLTLQFADKNWKITYLNREEKDYGEYQIADVTVDGEKINFVPKQHEAILPKNMIEKLSGNETHQIEVVLAQGNITL